MDHRVNRTIGHLMKTAIMICMRPGAQHVLEFSGAGVCGSGAVSELDVQYQLGA